MDILLKFDANTSWKSRTVQGRSCENVNRKTFNEENLVVPYSPFSRSVSKRLYQSSGRYSMTIQKLLLGLLGCIAIWHFLQGVSGQSCLWNGFKGCECNFIGACVPATPTPKPKPIKDRDKMSSYAPRGLDQFRYRNARLAPVNLAYLCEGTTVAILYDCNARIPLYAATVMTGKQIDAGYKRLKLKFRKSGDLKLDIEFQQVEDDYDKANKRNMCYETRRTGKYFVDRDWWRAANPKDSLFTKRQCTTQYASTKSRVRRGHLIAASYARGEEGQIPDTFTYTNAVPQFAVFNGGQWLSGEKLLMEWGRSYCNIHKDQPTENIRMHIVVGTIPSTYGTFKRRFFGKSGFSDYQGTSKVDSTYGLKTGKSSYRINVPRIMWSAACCQFEYVEKKGSKKIRREVTKSTAFFRENEPGRQKLNVPDRMVSLFATMGLKSLVTIDLFPDEHQDCYDDKNFVILRELSK